MSEIWVALASTSWRGWECEEDYSRCIEIGYSDCHVGTYDVLNTGDECDIVELANLAINEATARNLPIVWSFQDIVYSEPEFDFEEVAKMAERRESNYLASIEVEDEYDPCDDEYWCDEEELVNA